MPFGFEIEVVSNSRTDKRNRGKNRPVEGMSKCHRKMIADHNEQHGKRKIIVVQRAQRARITQ